MKSNTAITAATSNKQNTISSSSFLHGNEFLPESLQTENRLEALSVWPLKIHKQLLFLSHEDSNYFTNIVATFDKKLQLSESKKNIIALLLALKDFVAQEKIFSLFTHFFIKIILKNYHFLIENYRDCSAKLHSLNETVDLSNSSEKLKKLQNKLLALRKEKNQLQKSLLSDFELTHLTLLTNDPEKFKFKFTKDFMQEITMHEKKLKLYTQELNEKEQVENTIRNKSGWNFFSKKFLMKLKKSIKFSIKNICYFRIRNQNERSNLIMLSLFSEIYLLINQKNSSTKYLQNPVVKNFYQSLQQSLIKINNKFFALIKSVKEMDNIIQPTCFTFSY